MKRMLVIQVAALGWDLWQKHRDDMPNLSGLASGGTSGRLRPVFPALTASAQATFVTGTLPAGHGIVANGFFSRELLKPFFWEQSAHLVEGERIWERLKRDRPDATCAMLFWQNSVGSGNDFLLSPVPIHKHGGGIIDACYCKPAGLYDELSGYLGPFRLRWYWGPFTSVKASRWIARATAQVLKTYGPTLVLTYLPHLDYCLQKYGPADDGVLGEVKALDAILGELFEAAGDCGYEVCLFSDYAMSEVRSAIFPNRLLSQAGFFKTRTVNGRLYPDYAESRAIAICDHQVAHIYCKDAGLVGDIRDVLSSDGRVERIYSGDELAGLGLAHARCGELVAVARDDAWLAYPWWAEDRRAPDFARHVDIHNKPGFDPLEMFFDPWHMGISLDTGKVRGSHGRAAADGSTDAVLITSQGIAFEAVSAQTELSNAVLGYLAGA